MNFVSVNNRRGNIKNNKITFVVSLVYNYMYVDKLILMFEKQTSQNFKVIFYISSSMNELISKLRTINVINKEVVVLDISEEESNKISDNLRSDPLHKFSYESNNFNDFIYKYIFSKEESKNNNNNNNELDNENSLSNSYVMFINDNIVLDEKFVENFNKLDDLDPSNIYYLSFYDVYRKESKNKKEKKIKIKENKKFFIGELSNYKSMKYLLERKKIYPYISNYLFSFIFIKKNKLSFDKLLCKDNELSFLLKSFYYVDKLVSLNTSLLFVKYDRSYCVSKSNYKFDKQINSIMDTVYLFKLFLHNQSDYSVYKSLFSSFFLYFRLFLFFVKSGFIFSMESKFTFIETLSFFVKRCFMLSRNHFVYYGQSYTKLIENNNVMDNYDNSFTRECKYSFVVFYDSCIKSEDENRLFFKNLLNSVVHSYEVIIVVNKDESVLLNKDISVFIKKYTNVFKLYEIDKDTSNNYENVYESLVLNDVIKGKYVIFTTNNNVYSYKYLYYVDKVVCRNNNPSIVSCSYKVINKNLNICKNIHYKRSDNINCVLDERIGDKRNLVLSNCLVNKKNNVPDYFIFNKCISVELLKSVYENIHFSVTFKFDKRSMMFLTLLLLASSSKVCTISKCIISCYDDCNNNNNNNRLDKDKKLEDVARFCYYFKITYEYISVYCYDKENKRRALLVCYKKYIKENLKRVYKKEYNSLLKLLSNYIVSSQVDSTNVLQYMKELINNIK